MRTTEDSNDAAFGALRARGAAAAQNFDEDMVAVHGVLDGVARNEDVAVELGHGRVGNDEAVAVMVENEAAGDFITSGRAREAWRRRSVALW